MSKGQPMEKLIKKTLKFLKLREDSISTIMGAVVVIVIAGLMFNYFRTSSLKSIQGRLLEQQETTSTSSSDLNAELKLDPRPEVYKVVKGDDLWHIAERFYGSGYNYVDIIKENKLTDGVIYANQELKMPKVESKKITVAVAKKNEGVRAVVAEKNPETNVQNIVSAKAIGVGEYVTQKGDTYWNIAVRAYGDGFKWTKIYWANRKVFANPDVIHSNVKIVIPALDK